MRAVPASRLIAAIACACACAAGAAPLDTLFHTPQERERYFYEDTRARIFSRPGEGL